MKKVYYLMLETLGNLELELSSLSNKINNEKYYGKFFAKKSDKDIIGKIINIYFDLKSNYFGITMELCIEYEPLYMYNLRINKDTDYQDCVERIHIKADDIANIITADDIDSLKLLLEVAD